MASSFGPSAGTRLVVEVEPDAAAPERAPSVDPAREPQIVESPRLLHVEDHLLALRVDVESRVRAVEAVVVSPRAVVARQIMSLDAGIENGVA